MRSRPVPGLLVLLVGLTVLLGSIPGEARADNYKVGIYYFGVFNAGSCNVCVGNNTDWWWGVREYHAGQPHPEFAGEDFSHLKPAIGFYDNSQPGTLETHIKQARANGVDYFNFYWYWSSTANGGQGGETFGDGLQAFLAARNSLDLEFVVSITAHPWGNLNIPPAHAPRAIDRVITFLRQPHYLRTADGRPVVFLIDSRGIGVGNQTEVTNFLALLDQRVRAQMGGVSPFIVFSTELNGTTGPTGVGPAVDINGLGAVDGHSCLNYFGISLNPGSQTLGTLSRYNDRIFSVLGGWDNRPQIPCYMPDFNEKPRTYVGLPPSEVRYLTDWSLTGVRQGLQGLKSYVDGPNEAPVSNHLVLYAWNEWREEGHVWEPSEKDGNLMLEQLAQVFDLDTFGGAACRDRGNCPESFQAPTGTLDRPNSQTDCQRIAGWARDGDTSLPNWVDLYRGDPAAGGSFVQRVPANRLRPDLPFRDKVHGFDIAMPAAFETGQLEEIYAYAVDIGVNGNPVGRGPLLNRSPFTIRCGDGGGVPVAPSNVAATDGSFGDRVRVTWAASGGATAYEVWRHTSLAAGNRQRIAANVTATAFNDTTAPAGVTHWYWIKAKSAAGASPASSPDDGYRLSGAIVADFFANTGSTREVGDPLNGTFTEVGTKRWTAGSAAGFGAGSVTNRTSATSLVGGIPFQLSEHPTRRYFTVVASVDPTASSWSGLGFSRSPGGGYWTDARVWMYLRPTGRLQVRASGTAHSVYNGFPASFRPGRNSMMLLYDKVENRLRAWLNHTEISLANPDLDAFGFNPSAEIRWAGFHLYKQGGFGASTAELDDFALHVSGNGTTPQTLTVAPNADAFVAQAAPDTNFGSVQALRVRLPGSGQGHFTFLRFNVPAFQGTVTSARLRLRTQNRFLSEVFLHRVENMSWNENTVTWNNWGQGGVTHTQVATETNLAAHTWHELEVTGAVTGSGQVTIGINTSVDLPELDFFSRESIHDPSLIVTYQP